MAYKDIIKNAIRSFEDLDNWLNSQKAKVDPRLKDVIAKYPMRVNTYYLGLIEKMNDGIWKQAIPMLRNLSTIWICRKIRWMRKVIFLLAVQERWSIDILTESCC